jgi:hypothetical protein
VVDKPNLRIVEQSPWNRAEAYEPEAIQRIRNRLNGKPRHYRPSYFSEVAADWRDIISEVRGSPYSHATVAVLTVIAWTAVLVVPTLIGAGK